MQTLLLDTDAWDLVLDANGNIAVASEPYSLAQDAASAVMTFLGEVYYDTTVGIDYLGQIFGKNVPLSLIKSKMVTAARTVPDIATADVFYSGIDNRTLLGQIQVTAQGQSAGIVAAIDFSVINPQGGG
jgi:ribosomal protein S19E (S16A)